MKKEEKQAMENVPAEYRPLTMWQYVGYEVLWSIPLIGWIFWVTAWFDTKRIAKREFARHILLWYAIAFVLVIVLVLLLVGISVGAIVFDTYTVTTVA